MCLPPCFETDLRPILKYVAGRLGCRLARVPFKGRSRPVELEWRAQYLAADEEVLTDYNRESKIADDQNCFCKKGPFDKRSFCDVLL